MPTVPLPNEPSLEHLRNHAKALKRAVRGGDPDARAEVDEGRPAGALDDAGAASFPLSGAQLVVARRYGFASWTRLKRHVELVERYTRFPARLSEGEPRDLADRFLRLACLSYDDVGPTQWAEARALLAEHPGIGAGDVHVASVAADVPALRRILEVDPAAARREGGPYRWEPLLYLTYARHDPAIAESSVIGAARLILAAGADPNVGYLWHGQPSPFTALTGALGEGELGPVLQPRHPHSLALGRVLLEAGADPNDAQAMYNRMFEPGNDHLELLFEFGLGRGQGGPWRRRLGDAIPTPVELVRDDLDWAITHGMAARVELLVDHGVDVTSAFADGNTPAGRALTTGHSDLVDYLVAHGAPKPELTPSEAFAAAALRGDGAGIDQLELRHPDLRDEVRSTRPGLMAWAATTGRGEVIEFLVALGFDIDAKGRTDVPSNQPWQTALHHAAMEGDLSVAQTLLRLGANPNVKDERFGATPLGWARHGGHASMVELLEPLTGPSPK